MKFFDADMTRPVSVAPTAAEATGKGADIDTGAYAAAAPAFFDMSMVREAKSAEAGTLPADSRASTGTGAVAGVTPNVVSVHNGGVSSLAEAQQPSEEQKKKTEDRTGAEAVTMPQEEAIYATEAPVPEPAVEGKRGGNR